MSEQIATTRLSGLDIIRQWVSRGVRAIEESDTYKNALAVATQVETGFSIKTAEDMQQAADAALLAKRGVKVIDEGLKNAFADIKLLEKTERDRYAPTKMRIERTVERIDAERHAFRRREEARIREEQRLAQVESERAAKAAAEAAEAGAVMDDEAPPAAQVVAPKVETIQRGAIGKSVETRRVVVAEIVDPVAVAQAWGHLVTVDQKGALAEYAVLMRRGTADYPGEAGVVVNGIRFATKVGFSDGRA